MSQISSYYWPSLLGVCVALLPAPSVAQDKDVPREFVDVLWLQDIYGSRPTRLYVGQVPDALASLVKGRGVRIIGAIDQGSNTSVAVAVRGPAEDALQEWERKVEEAGWTIKPSGPFDTESGFTSSTPRARVRAFCSPTDNGMLSLRAVDAPGEETYMRMQYQAPRQGPGCMQMTATSTRVAVRATPVPALYPPAGAIVQSSSSGGSSNDWHTSASITSELSMEELLKHYGSEMQLQEWKLVEEVTGKTAGMSVWRLEGADGAVWTGWFTIALLQDSIYGVQLQLIRK